jgi:hypothetical protein
MYRARVGGVEGLLCKIDVAPLDVEGVVWIDFAHGSSSAPCAQDTVPTSYAAVLKAAMDGGGAHRGNGDNSGRGHACDGQATILGVLMVAMVGPGKETWLGRLVIIVSSSTF